MLYWRGPAVTLGFVIEDYILHMQHHIDQLLGREVVTQYPGATVAAALEGQSLPA